MKNTNLAAEEKSNLNHIKSIIKKKRREFLNKKIKQIEVRLYRLNETLINPENLTFDEDEYEETSALLH